MPDTPFHRAAQILADLFLLSLLWLVGCLPVVTAAPATAAMLAVAAEWQQEGAPNVVRSFKRHFKALLRPGIRLGLLWLPAGVLLLVNLNLSSQLPEAVRLPAVVWLCFLGWLYLCISTRLLITLPRCGGNSLQTLRTAATVALANPSRSLTGVGLLISLAAVVYVLPGLLLIAPAIAAHGLQRLWHDPGGATVARDADPDGRVAAARGRHQERPPAARSSPAPLGTDHGSRGYASPSPRVGHSGRPPRADGGGGPAPASPLGL
jgi:uncharacterized membrane protein YesL